MPDISTLMPWIEQINEWIELNEPIILWLAFFSVLTFIGTLIAVALVIILLPADYFQNYGESGHRFFKNSIPRLILVGFKNLFGILFILTGLALLVLPGQGIITLLIGLSLVNFPGKRTLIRHILRQEAILRSINRMRTWINKPPLQSPE